MILNKAKFKPVFGYGLLFVLVLVFVCLSVGSGYGLWASDIGFGSDGTAFTGNFPNQASLIFELGMLPEIEDYGYIAMQAVTSDFNCTVSNLGYGSGVGGSFQFSPLNDCSIEFATNVGDLSLQLNGVGVGDGSVVNLITGVGYELTWMGYDLIIFNSNVDVTVQAVIVMVVLFAPAVGLILITKSKWGFIAGWTAGGVLGYCFLPQVGVEFPTWVLFGVVLVDATMFLAVWRGNI